MRIINHLGRLRLVVADGVVDVATASHGRFGPDVQSVYEAWPQFQSWAAHADLRADAPMPPDDQLGPPVPNPRQVFAVGLNYADHADESGFVKPDEPLIFTKFPSSLSGPMTVVDLPPGSVDWEVELVVVLGKGGRDIPIADAWSHVAGLTIGQDLSERTRQHAGPAPQFSLAKSHAGFSPLGPAVVTLDEIPDPDDLDISASIDDEVVQSGRTSQLIFPVPDLVARLSGVVELYPGDIIFTGTPSGVGAGRKPPRFLQPGETLRSRIEGLGELIQRFRSRQPAGSLPPPTLEPAGR